MFLIGFPAAAFATNCFVIAPSDGEQCLIVDPGIGVLDRLEALLRDHRLKPAAVVLTHGHLDHTYSVTPVCGSSDDVSLPAYIHRADHYRLRDPLAMTEPELVAMLEAQFGRAATWQEPSDIVEYDATDDLVIAGLHLQILHTPGHTEGSAIFRLDGVPDQLPADSGLDSTLIAGDLLFAGGIGRTDLAGGDDAAMRTSLKDVVLQLPDTMLVFPGHGPATTIARERQSNPYLQPSYLA